MTGFNSKRQAAKAKVRDDDDTQVYADKKRGSIALARSLCYQINGAADDSDDIDGGGYGSVDVAEILSAEVVRLQAALAQPEQEPMTEVADRFAHRMALELECVLSDGAYSNKWYTSAMQVLSEYRSAMNAIHEQHSPTFMGEPKL